MNGFDIEALQKMKEATELTKKRLESIISLGEAGSGLVRIELNGNKKLMGLEINTDLKSIDKEDLEDLLAIALEKALEEVEKKNESELKNSALNFFPNFK